MDGRRSSFPGVVMLRTCCLFLLVTAACGCRGQWQLASESGKDEAGHGVWQMTKTAKGAAELELSLVFFDMKRVKAGIVAQPVAQRREARSLAEIAGAAGAIAACNGGYFTPQFGPSGLEIAGGTRLGEWQKDLPFGGVLYVRKGELVLEGDSEFRESGEVTDLVQCCPMLVQGGVALRGIGGADQVARTFVATDGGGKWLIGCCPRAALEDLAEALVAPAVIHEFRVQSALNLDGGPSSGLWWRGADGGAHGFRSTTQVRNVVVVLPR